MTAMHKIMLRPHLCQNCGIEVRMKLIATVVVGMIYFGSAVRTLMNVGMNAKGLLYVLVLTALFVGACLYIPFEEKPQSES
ncbi:MAG: hypothetical protein RLZZ227_1692 [Pseudomonadota bacterium]|jgi:ABC-type uncharacterized transport system permease subunit